MLLSNPDLDLLRKDSQELFQHEQLQDLLFCTLLWSQPLMTELPELDEGLLGSGCFLIAEMPETLAGGLWSRVTPLKGNFLLPVGILFQLHDSKFFLHLRSLNLLVYSYSHCSAQRRTLQLGSEAQTSSLTTLGSYPEIGVTKENLKF